MDIITSLLNFLKGLNLKYEKNNDEHSFDLNIDDENTNLKGSLSVKLDKDKPAEVSAKFGENKEE